MDIEHLIAVLENGIIEKKKVIVRLYAEWCRPCTRITPAWNNIKKTYNLDSKFIIIDLNVDESVEIYTTLKKYRMVNGIPAFLLWEPHKREKWYLHDNGICNGDPNIIKLWIQNMM